MNRQSLKTLLSCLMLLLGLQASLALAADEAADDTYANEREGARIFTFSCLPCHSVKYVRLQNLQELGFTADDVSAMLPGSKFDSPLNSYIASDDAERFFGLAPPDLTLMVKARATGKEHIVTLLTSYQLNAEQAVENTFMPVTKMPDIFSFAVASDDAWKQEVERRARRVSDFLEWAADPSARERRELGVWVILYLLVLTTLFYLVKRRVWADVDEKK